MNGTPHEIPAFPSLRSPSTRGYLSTDEEERSKFLLLLLNYEFQGGDAPESSRWKSALWYALIPYPKFSRGSRTDTTIRIIIILIGLSIDLVPCTIS